MNNMKLIEDFNGFMFIGSPRLSSSKPGHRIEKDETFMQQQLKKFEWALSTAKETKTIPVITGDFLHKARDIKVLIPIMNILKGMQHPLYVLKGKTDAVKGQIDDQCVLRILEAFDLVKIIETKGWVDQFQFGDKTVSLYAVPHGETIPQRLRHPSGKSSDMTITIAYEHYDDIDRVFDVSGCDAVINGAYIEQRSDSLESTLWITPGSMSRMTLREANNLPSVLMFAPKSGFDGIEVPHETDAFSVDNEELEHSELNDFMTESDFVNLLETEAEGLDEGFETELKEEVEQLADDERFSEVSVGIVTSIYKNIVHDEMDDFGF